MVLRSHSKNVYVNTDIEHCKSSGPDIINNMNESLQKKKRESNLISGSCRKEGWTPEVVRGSKREITVKNEKGTSEDSKHSFFTHSEVDLNQIPNRR